METQFLLFSFKKRIISTKLCLFYTLKCYCIQVAMSIFHNVFWELKIYTNKCFTNNVIYIFILWEYKYCVHTREMLFASTEMSDTHAIEWHTCNWLLHNDNFKYYILIAFALSSTFHVKWISLLQNITKTACM